MPNSAKRLTVPQTQSLIKKVDRLSDLSSFSMDETKAYAKPLSFYPGTKIIELKDNSVFPHKIVHVCEGPQGVALISYAPDTMAELNRIYDLLLTEDTICDYVPFYFRFTRSPEGQARVIDTVDDLNLRDDIAPQQRKVLSQAIRKLAVKSASKSAITCSGTLLFNNALFACDIAVDRKSGKLTIGQRELLLAELPVFDETSGF